VELSNDSDWWVLMQFAVPFHSHRRFSAANLAPTAITLVVPGGIVFWKSSPRILNKLWNLLGGDAKHPPN
jgi:hypothetical protein